MGKIEEAIRLAKEIAADNSHGYDQASRWGKDYDCSSLVITVWENAGVPVKTNGASYTGNMRGTFLRTGFEDVTSSVDITTGAGLVAGDVLLNNLNHTALYIGNGQLVQASINENGNVTGGKTGDQTGKEISVRSYYNYPWDCVLRYTGDNASAGNESVGEEIPETYTVKKGDTLYDIAVKFYGDGSMHKVLAEINNVTGYIYPGQVLKLYDDDCKDCEIEQPKEEQETPKEYTVKSGDNLWDIAGKIFGNNQKWEYIAKLNGIGEPFTIYPGQKLKLR